VKGAFEGVLPDDRGTGVASVYAEFPRRQERLKLDRVLSADEYATMLAAIDSWASQDRVWAEVTSAFGAPSVLFGSTDPYYGKTLGYVTADPPTPMLLFPSGTAPTRAPSLPGHRAESSHCSWRSAVVTLRSPPASLSLRKDGAVGQHRRASLGG
jgi:hypothetical protein